MRLPGDKLNEARQSAVARGRQVLDRARGNRAAVASLRTDAAASDPLRTTPATLIARFAIPGWARSDPSRYVANMLALDGIDCRPSLTDSEPAAKIELRAGAAGAIQGAVVVTLVAVAAGLYAYWLYGLLVAVAGASAIWLAAGHIAQLDRRAPRAIPRGRVLGAALAFIAITIVLVLIALPVHFVRGTATPASVSQVGSGG